jgi:hypothetical protein
VVWDVPREHVGSGASAGRPQVTAEPRQVERGSS